MSGGPGPTGAPCIRCLALGRELTPQHWVRKRPALHAGKRRLTLACGRCSGLQTGPAAHPSCCPGSGCQGCSQTRPAPVRCPYAAHTPATQVHLKMACLQPTVSAPKLAAIICQDTASRATLVPCCCPRGKASGNKPAVGRGRGRWACRLAGQCHSRRVQRRRLQQWAASPHSLRWGRRPDYRIAAGRRGVQPQLTFPS